MGGQIFDSPIFLGGKEGHQKPFETMKEVKVAKNDLISIGNCMRPSKISV